MLPLPLTFIPPHPCLAQPPVETVKSVIPLRTALRLLVCLQFFLVIAVLVTPSPEEATGHSISVFLGFMATHSTMPVRYHGYAIFSTFMCVSATARYSSRISTPEFGYSKPLKLLTLASQLNHWIHAAKTVPSEVVLAAVSYENANSTAMLGPYRSSRPRSSKKGTGMKEGKEAEMKEEKRKEMKEKMKMLEGGKLTESPKIDAPEEGMADSMRRFLGLQPSNPPPEDQTKTDIRPKKTYLFPVQLEPFFELHPSTWRIYLDMVVSGTLCVLSAISTIMAIILGRKLESIISRSLMHNMGGNQDETHPLIPAVAPPSNREVYNNREAGSFRPYTGNAVTLADISS